VYYDDDDDTLFIVSFKFLLIGVTMQCDGGDGDGMHYCMWYRRAIVKEKGSKEERGGLPVPKDCFCAVDNFGKVGNRLGTAI
jgi:hypothetical protein